MKTELQLIHLVEMHPEVSIANSAMKEIRERFHGTIKANWFSFTKLSLSPGFPILNLCLLHGIDLI